MIQVQGAPLDSMIRMTASDLHACITAIKKAEASNLISHTAANIITAKLSMARRYVLGSVDTLNMWEDEL